MHTPINNTHKTRLYTQHKLPEAYKVQTQPEPHTHQSTIHTKQGYTHSTNPQQLTKYGRTQPEP